MTGRSACGERSRGSTRPSPDSVRPSPPGAARIGELSTVVSGLGDSMQRYCGNLDTLGTRVAGLHAQAVQLEHTADAALATGSGGPVTLNRS